MPRLVAVVGAVTPPGRLNAAMQAAVDAAAARPGVTASLVSLADYRLGFADGRPLETRADDAPALIRALAEADAVIFASPVYRGSFTGALKNLLDLTPVDVSARQADGHRGDGRLARITTWAWTGICGRCSPGSAPWWRPRASTWSRPTSRTGKLADPAAAAALSDLVTTVLDAGRGPTRPPGPAAARRGPG